MSRKTASDSGNGFADVIGFALLAIALLLLVAQFSFDRNDLAFVHTPPNHPAHNWIGPFGAHIAYVTFFLFGIAAFILPFMLAAFGAGCIFKFLSHLRERRLWLGLWSVVLLFSLSGLLEMMNGPLKTLRENLDAPGAGGWLGNTLFDFKLFGYDWGFWAFGPVGATIVYAALCFISLLFLTNFQIGIWIRRLFEKESEGIGPVIEGESALDRRARELEKQAKKLQEEVTRSGLGADMQPVPEPTVRDLSVPQAKGPRFRKTTLPEPAKESEAVPTDAEEAKPDASREVPAATTEEILGKKTKAEKPAEDKTETPVAEQEKSESKKTGTEKTDGPKAEPAVHIADNSVSKPRAAKKPRPITVASTPLIGNYQLPPMDFLQHADMTLKPTESREELMANARLMQQTLAQFEIEVSLGDITKGPTITRYELHPAPGVKLE